MSSTVSAKVTTGGPRPPSEAAEKGLKTGVSVDGDEPEADAPKRGWTRQPPPGNGHDGASPLCCELLADGVRLRLLAGRAGDHACVQQLLGAVFHGPSPGEFQALIDEPLYEPSDRLLIKEDRRILAHVHLTKRTMRFGQLTLPVAGLHHLATVSEHREGGLATVLLREAERKMAADGAVLGMLYTSIPDFFQRRGWVIAGRHCCTTASARDVLAHFSAEQSQRPALFQKPPPRLNIRLWRHVEQDALGHLYRDGTDQSLGPPLRSHTYWRWLISRQAFDRIYVAIRGRQKVRLQDTASRIVGYAVARRGRIVEIMTSPAHPTAMAQLLARVCADAIEQDHHGVRLDAPPGHPLHAMMVAAGGRHLHDSADQGEVSMARLADPLKFLAGLESELHGRARAANLTRPSELGLLLAGEKHRLLLTRRGVKLAAGKLGRSYLSCEVPEFTQLLLGHFDPAQAIQAGRIETSTRIAQEIAQALFPKLPFWRPPLDDLPA